MPPIRIVGTLVVLLAAPLAAPALHAQSPCDDDPAYAVLDFWVGEWDVMVGERQVGSNRIEKVLSGCALLEHWTGARGSAGKSLFYRVPAEDAWKQVWVTDDPSRPGGVKEKRLIEHTQDGGTVFRGEVTTPGGQVVLDQTRLIPLDDGTVRQVIEYSENGGASWQQVFDAVYVRTGRAASKDPGGE